MIGVLPHRMKGVSMRKLLVVTLVGGLMAFSGCANTRRGYSLDVIAHEAQTVRRMENKLAESNPRVIEDLTNITAETSFNTATWTARLNAAKKALYEKALQYDNNSAK
jgi:hypothetical protein